MGFVLFFSRPGPDVRHEAGHRLFMLPDLLAYSLWWDRPVGFRKRSLGFHKGNPTTLEHKSLVFLNLMKPFGTLWCRKLPRDFGRLYGN